MHRGHRLLRFGSAGGQGAARNVHYEHAPANAFSSRVQAHALQFLHDLNTQLFCAAILPEAVRQKADVYVGRGLEALAPAYLAAQANRAKLVYDSLELWTERVRTVPYGPLHKAAVAWVEKRMCRRCDLVTTVTPSLAAIMAERYGIAEPMVIPNTYYSYAPLSPSPDIRQRLTDHDDHHVAIYAGFLQPGKGLECLIDAAQYLQGMTVAIVGDGVLRPALEARVREKRLEDRVRFVGWVKTDELPAYAASADVGVSPMQGTSINYYYGGDYKLYLYIIAGIPLAVSNHPERKRLVEQYGIGATFDEADPHDIARVITDLLSDPAAYQGMRERCQKVGREELNWEVVSQRFVAAIEQLK